MAGPLLARAVGAKPVLAVVAPSFAVDPERLTAGCRVLEAAGFTLCRRDDLTRAEGYLAGSDERRAAELQAWVADPGVDGILCARGGYGVARILPRLDAAAFARARKPLVGYSDVTALLLWQRATSGLVGFHGPMFDAAEGPTPEELERLGRALRGDPLDPMVGEGVVAGTAEGPLVGGSLTLLANSLGTPWEVDTRGAILLIEEIGEKPYAIDRHLQHLRDAGKLDAAVAFGIGHLLGCTDPKREQPDRRGRRPGSAGRDREAAGDGLALRPSESQSHVANGGSRPSRWGGGHRRRAGGRGSRDRGARRRAFRAAA